MKKKTMRNIFILLFIVGIVVGYVLPGDLKSLSKRMSADLKPSVIDVSKRFGQLDIESQYAKLAVLYATEAGSARLVRIDDKVPMHVHPKENHFVYVYKGRAKFTLSGQEHEALPGYLIVVPAGIPHSVQRIGDTPLELIEFSAPPAASDGTVYLEN